MPRAGGPCDWPASRKMLQKIGVLLCLWAMPCALARAQAEPIETDNPSLANSSKTVGEGVFQWESGVLHLDPRRRLERARRGRTDRDDADESAEGSYASAPNLFRLGVSPALELRFESEMLAHQSNLSGFSDVSLGFKWTLAESDDASVGLIGSLTPPSGKTPFRTNSFTPTLIVASDFAITEDQTLTLNLGGSWVDNERLDRRIFESFGAICYNWDLGEQWTAYLEVAVSGPEASSQAFETIADAGLGYRPTPNSIINLALFRGLSHQGMDWGTSLSFGLRL